MVTVTDLSDRMLEVAAENAGRRGLKNFQTKQCDAGALPFPDRSFDAVLCRFGFMFFPDVDLSVKEFVRVAKPEVACAPPCGMRPRGIRGPPRLWAQSVSTLRYPRHRLDRLECFDVPHRDLWRQRFARAV